MTAADSYQRADIYSVVSVPRTVLNILLDTAAIHFIATWAYLHLLSLPPRQRRQPRWLRCLQCIIFLHIPELLIAQLASTLLLPRLGRPRNPVLQQFVKLVSFENLVKGVDLQDSTKLARFRPVLTLACGVLSLFAFCAYVSRFAIRYHSATDVGNLGLDHRNGLMAFYGLAVAVFSMALVFYIRAYRRQHRFPDLGPKETDYHHVLEGEDDDEVLPVPSIHVISCDDMLTFFEISVATLLHQIPLILTHHDSPVFEVIGNPVSIIVLVPLVWVATYDHRQEVADRAKALLVMFVFGLTAATIILQWKEDVSELEHAVEGYVRPWNYRWKVHSAITMWPWKPSAI